MEPANLYILAVGGVVYRCPSHRQIELLLIKKHGGYWTLPKGRIKRDETPIAAVQREIFEETGLAGAVERPIQEVNYQIVKRGQPCHKIVMYYLFEGVK